MSPRSPAKTDGGGSQKHGEYLIEENGTTKGQDDESIVEEPIGDLLPAADGVNTLVGL